MVSQGRSESSEDPPYRVPAREESNPAANSNSITLGLVPAPEMPEKVACELANELPELLKSRIDEQVSWHVEVVTDPLTGASSDAPQILDETEKIMRDREWELAICITDLPIHRAKQVVVADASSERGVGRTSFPPLGVSWLQSRLREATLQLVNEMYAEEQNSGGNVGAEAGERDTSEGDGASTTARVRGEGPRQLLGNRLTERLSPIKRITPDESDSEVDVRFVAPRISGRIRLLAGMVLANRPWSIFPAFKSVIALAFATGAYGLIFPTLWLLSDSFGSPRFVALMIMAIAAMVFWIIVSHSLWEKPSDEGSRYLASLYNAATALTLSVAVVLYYIVLFVLFLVAVLVFVPAGLLQSQLGHSVSLINYMALAWLACSVATIAGALGAGLESDETVRNATYGYRQRKRAEKRQEDTPQGETHG